jgi:hypothetical protein
MATVKAAWRRSFLAVSAALVLLLALVVLASATNLLPSWSNPFREETKDRSGPAVLKSVRDMSRYQAASGDFQVVVDLEKDARFLPDSLRGRRTLYIGAGTVGAYVDLGGLPRKGVKVNKERTTASLELPRARLESAKLNPGRSYVFAQQKGVLDRFGDFFSGNPGDQRELQKLAAKKISKAAAHSGLARRAEANTRRMLSELLGSLGFRDVRVHFDRR